MILRPCLDCSRLCEKLTRGRCRDCRRRQDEASFYQSREWRGLRDRLLGDRCDLCGGTFRLTLHHTRNRRAGGSDSPDNLRWTLCGNCHSELEGDIRAGRESEIRKLVEQL